VELETFIFGLDFDVENHDGYIWSINQPLLRSADGVQNITYIRTENRALFYQRQCIASCAEFFLASTNTFTAAQAQVDDIIYFGIQDELMDEIHSGIVGICNSMTLCYDTGLVQVDTDRSNEDPTPASSTSELQPNVYFFPDFRKQKTGKDEEFDQTQNDVSSFVLGNTWPGEHFRHQFCIRGFYLKDSYPDESESARESKDICTVYGTDSFKDSFNLDGKSYEERIDCSNKNPFFRYKKICSKTPHKVLIPLTDGCKSKGPMIWMTTVPIVVIVLLLILCRKRLQELIYRLAGKNPSKN